MTSGPVHIVVIDDNPKSLELLSMALKRTGVTVHAASDPMRGVELVRDVHPRLVITDLVMPGMGGLEVVDRVLEFDPLIDIIVITAHYTTETAVEAIRRGAADYLQKPVNIPLLRERITDFVQAAEQRREALTEADLPQEQSFEGMLARSPAMWGLFAMIQRIAPHYRSVLIQGPTGAGKDLVAAALHRRSGVSGRFVVLNCSAIVETLFESELFGHVRGAFTGADRDKTGLFELANQGTLFLDEIGDMPLSTQAKLLRAVQNQEILPVGSLSPRRVNVRIVAATHRDLRAAVAAGRFREDLYYRLGMVELTVPPLRDRPEDVPLLARFFARKYAKDFNRTITGVSPRALRVLENHRWPGNVRELEHVIGRACMLSSGGMLDVRDLPASVLEPAAGAPQQEQPATLEAQERRLIEGALREAAGNVSEAARRLGIGRDALRYRIRQFRLSVDERAGSE